LPRNRWQEHLEVMRHSRRNSLIRSTKCLKSLAERAGGPNHAAKDSTSLKHLDDRRMARSSGKPSVARKQARAEFLGRYNAYRGISGKIVTELPNPGQEHEVGIPRNGEVQQVMNRLIGATGRNRPCPRQTLQYPGDLKVQEVRSMQGFPSRIDALLDALPDRCWRSQSSTADASRTITGPLALLLPCEPCRSQAQLACVHANAPATPPELAALRFLLSQLTDNPRATSRPWPRAPSGCDASIGDLTKLNHL